MCFQGVFLSFLKKLATRQDTLVGTVSFIILSENDLFKEDLKPKLKKGKSWCQNWFTRCKQTNCCSRGLHNKKQMKKRKNSSI